MGSHGDTEEKLCICGHLDYEHTDAKEFNVSPCHQCPCKEFTDKDEELNSMYEQEAKDALEFDQGRTR